MATPTTGGAVLVSTTPQTPATTRITRSSRESNFLSPGGGSMDKGTGVVSGLSLNGYQEPRRRCDQCPGGQRHTLCTHHNLGYNSQSHSSQQQREPEFILSSSVASASGSGSRSGSGNGSHSAAALQGPLTGTSSAAHNHLQRPRRISKLKHRSLTATLADLKNAGSLSNNNIGRPRSSGSPVTQATTQQEQTSPAGDDMEPPVLSFYGTEPVPLPSRFAQIKRSLVAGHEKELEASWARLIAALRDEVDNIASRGSSITPSIDFTNISNPSKKSDFARDLKRYGLGVIRGVVPHADAQKAIDETVKYLETKHDFKDPTPQDPTCFDFFWSPAQVRTRAHPKVLQAQRFAMSLWDNDADDRMATRFPIAYADRLRIHGANIGGVGPDAAEKKASEDPAAAEAQKAAMELLGDFASSTVIAQVDNGSLERWESDGYGRGGTYDAVFKGEWEKYDPWDPTYRVTATPDLYNGYGACSIFRMYQGIVALSTIDPGMVRLLPSPKLATAYFLLRPFFSPKNPPPERREGPEWDAFLDASNWSLDAEQSTIIHGAVPGHAQRLTELWHPHLHLRRTLTTLPTLQTGDYIVWHPDLAYHITSNPNTMASRAPTPPPPGANGDDDDSESPVSKPVSILVYVPAAPLTQTNALYLARQRKTFQRGHPGPDFDSTGSGLGSEASHSGRPGETEIAEVGGPAGLQAMGLAPFDIAPTPTSNSSNDGEADADEDVEMEGTTTKATTSDKPGSPSSTEMIGGVSNTPVSRAEAEVARMANIILFPDRYDFYMGTRRASTTATKRKRSSADVNDEEKENDKGKRKEKSPITIVSKEVTVPVTVPVQVKQEQEKGRKDSSSSSSA
ncbi:hypothetical protein SMACR_09161 [Sordaria macrospora]|uniref:WGS project CABT00000000 data, contig 2.74 n=2 Tax=Sordaria macrospora TaxID=5147 RepID=F7WBD9_SORMK|nr:uncharacterized protein SMAC_09161 [Sordaria macrospora k-hell]KAA8633994.1 hypothetical protein SMACR_09161 [Sordaria macrospora]WPJ66170.1 hypothetical protein SMAC4_09161 [Sordaria macrospora]CCC14950.1 unnamed protein product [Sordaria macrospora k-hell]